MRVPRLRAVVVAGDSMTPRLLPGDWLLVLERGRIRPGDVVVGRRPHVADLLVVKRAVRRDTAGWWLLSDNAAAGIDDSRAFGPLPESAIVGRVLFRYFPVRRRARG